MKILEYKIHNYNQKYINIIINIINIINNIMLHFK